jgi:hypothetical protein
MYHYAILPLVSDSQMHGTPTRPGLLRQLERVEADAAAGCETSARFAEEYGPLLRLCDHLRNVRPPPRAADYHPSEILSDYQRQLLASPRRTWADEWEHEEGAD